MAPIGYSSDECIRKRQVWLYEYDLFEIKEGWGELRLAAAGVVMGATPHLTIVVYGYEYEVEAKGPCFIVHGSEDKSRPKPKKRTLLGVTEKAYDEFMFIYELLVEGRFCPGSYNIFTNNCIDFANALCIELLGKKLPDEYRSIVAEKSARVASILVASTVIVGGVSYIVYRAFKSDSDKEKKAIK